MEQICNNARTFALERRLLGSLVKFLDVLHAISGLVLSEEPGSVSKSNNPETSVRVFSSTCSGSGRPLASLLASEHHETISTDLSRNPLSCHYKLLLSRGRRAPCAGTRLLGCWVTKENARTLALWKVSSLNSARLTFVYLILLLDQQHQWIIQVIRLLEAPITCSVREASIS